MEQLITLLLRQEKIVKEIFKEEITKRFISTIYDHDYQKLVPQIGERPLHSFEKNPTTFINKGAQCLPKSRKTLQEKSSYIKSEHFLVKFFMSFLST